MDLFEEQLEALAEAVGCLSTTERDLLRNRTQQERFQDACILTFLTWSRHCQNGIWVPDAQTVHGTFGSLPRWNILARTDEEAESARAALSEGVLPLGFEQDPGETSRLLLVCRKPRTVSPGMRAHFAFDLNNPAHACELLLMARRSGVPIDLYGQSRTKPDEGRVESTHLGTVFAPIGRELAGLATRVATEALSRCSPGALGRDHDRGKGIEPLAKALGHLQHARADHFSFGRHIAVSPHRGLGGGVAVLSADPPVALSGFSKGTRVDGQSCDSRGTRTKPAGTGLPPSRSTGFVYVQRNPAFPDMLKIGYSDRLAEDRARDLSRTSVPFPFEVLFRALSSRPEEVERAVHRLLTAQRVSANREFFRVSLDTAIAAIRQCQSTATGITSWEPVPFIHRLRAGDRIVLPLKAGQLFTHTAHRQPLSSSAEVLDVWQAHADDDVLEIHATHDLEHVAGISDNDPGAYEDPVPFLDRNGTVRNAEVHGRERLIAGDRLIWLSDEEGPADTRGVVFEADAFCQVIYRTWNPQRDRLGMPLMLNTFDREDAGSMGGIVREALALGAPRTWTPQRAKAEKGEVAAVTEPQPPEYWLPQLAREHKTNHRRRS
ncbi:GIY-YIG nuclease family protein [Streptomyces sp. CA-132043]|uniref:GIY-YIG nuclease family protein n=1 Tax=Streptomyces sp. CA-132043 TaxID=3240048 RepID=UPI003D90E2D4